MARKAGEFPEYLGSKDLLLTWCTQDDSDRVEQALKTRLRVLDALKKECEGIWYEQVPKSE